MFTAEYVFLLLLYAYMKGKTEGRDDVVSFSARYGGWRESFSLAQIQVSVALNSKCLLFTKELIKLWSLKTNLTPQVLAPTAVLHYLIYATLNQSAACFTQPGWDI